MRVSAGYVTAHLYSGLMNIGVLGGTGPAGSALAVRLAAVGYPTIIGSRSADRAQDVTYKLLGQWAGHDLELTGANNTGAASADVVVVATPWDGGTFGLVGAASQRAPAEVELFARGPHEATGTFELGDANLDPETSRQVISFLQEINEEGGTVVMVTHDPAAAAKAKRTLRIVEGQLHA